ncbi:TrmH family RNA methyltransferase [Nesterenkonia suensis]
MTDPEVLSNPGADRVKKVAALATRAGRRRQRLFLAEGPQSVREALALWLSRWDRGGQPAEPQPGSSRSGLPTLDALYFDADAVAAHPDLQALLDEARGVLFDPQSTLPRHARFFLREATSEVLAAMGDAETSQGVLAVCRIPEASGAAAAGDPVAALLGRGARSGDETLQTALVAGLVGLQDPGNVGTIVRTADAAGADLVALTPGSADPWAPKVVRSAAGSHFHLPLVAGVDPQRLAEAARAAGLQILAADGGGESSLPELAHPEAATLWLFGNEAHGLSTEHQALADQRVSIPLYGQAESLNVATAATVCLYASAMARHQGGRGALSLQEGR